MGTVTVKDEDGTEVTITVSDDVRAQVLTWQEMMIVLRRIAENG